MKDEEVRKSLQRVVDRLQKLLELNAPDIILCNEVMTLLRRCFCLPDNVMGRAFGESLAKNMLFWQGLCIKCRDPLPSCSNDPLCLACSAKEQQS